MEHQFHEGDTLKVLGLDVFDPGAVKEMVFEVVSEEPFHLLRVHTAIRLSDIDSGSAKIWKDVHSHSLQGENCADFDRCGRGLDRTLRNSRLAANASGHLSKSWRSRYLCRSAVLRVGPPANGK